MRNTCLGLFFRLFVILILPCSGRGGQIDAQTGQLQMLSIQKKQWLITGQVQSLRGEPVSNARVQVHLASWNNRDTVPPFKPESGRLGGAPCFLFAWSR
jgi:hypothetical protein